MFIRSNRRGQSTLEYAVIIAVVVAALIAMQTYFKRGVQGKLRQATDDIGEQFSPGHTSSDYTIRTNVHAGERIEGGDEPVSSSTSYQKQTRDAGGFEKVDIFENEDWK